MSTPGIMIGRVNRSRPVPANRVRPRTRAKAAVVPMIVARIATMTATRTELNSAVWMAVSAIIASYQWVVRPVIGNPGLSAFSNENRMRNAIGR